MAKVVLLIESVKFSDPYDGEDYSKVAGVFAGDDAFEKARHMADWRREEQEKRAKDSGRDTFPTICGGKQNDNMAFEMQLDIMEGRLDDSYTDEEWVWKTYVKEVL